MTKLEGKDLAYWERNQLVAYLSKIFPARIEIHPETDTSWEKDWRYICVIQFPEGTYSWHFHDSEFKYFSHLCVHYSDNSYDGHTLEQKYEALSKKEYPC